MQLANVTRADASPGAATPFAARCNTPAAPRVQAGSQVSALSRNSSAADDTNGARTQAETISVAGAEQRVFEYVQYTIEY